MLGFLKVCIFLIIQIIIVQSSIPNLEVRKMDIRSIQRKRADTLEICRIFEKERKKEGTHRSAGSKQHQRPKRQINEPYSGIPTLREEDVQKVESIVDKLYDDMLENGQRVTYRQRILNNTTPQPESKLNEQLFNQSGRRFDFAPSFLLGPEGGKYVPGPPETVPVPWIKKWKHAIIPYFIDPKTYDNGLAEIIMTAFDYFERATCVRLQRLREKPQDRLSMEKVEWIYISNPTGIRQCVHSNERIPNIGVQMVVFGYDCMSHGEIVHEVMHILGFSHEHNRPDRDQHVSILWDNIKPGYKKYFQPRKDDPLLRLKYDYASVLHYPPRAFSKNGQVTINSKEGVKIGQRDGLSETDIEKVSLIFGNECVDRNKEYLLTTCPSVVRTKSKTKVATQHEIQHYFKDRIWKFGIINYKLRDPREFSSEERDNIQAVINHIQRETCIEFKDMAEDEEKPEEEDEEEEDKKPKSEGVMTDRDEADEKENLKFELNNKENDIPTGSKENAETPANVQSEVLAPGDGPPEGGPEEPPSGPPDATDAGSPDAPTTEGGAAETAAAENEASDTAAAESAAPDAAAEELVTEATTEASAAPEGGDAETPASEAPAARLRGKRSVGKVGRGKGGRAKTGKVKRAKGKKRKSGRRHADSVLVFTRSTEPGCKCPKPGKTDDDSSTIELNADCFNSVNDLLHVFVHILGLDHQHNMHDRDDFLHIVWDKLTPDVKKEMRNKLPAEAALGFPYDYQSVMHYPWLQIKNGVTNIMYPIWNDGWAMGHWQGLSATDVQKLSLLYYEQCLERKKQEDKAAKEE